MTRLALSAILAPITLAAAQLNLALHDAARDVDYLVQETEEKCPLCKSLDVVGPFEMDGFADGKYQASGLRWIVCRTCGRSSRVTS